MVIFILGMFLADNSIFFFEFLSTTIKQFAIRYFLINSENSFVLDILVLKSSKTLSSLSLFYLEKIIIRLNFFSFLFNFLTL